MIRIENVRAHLGSFRLDSVSLCVAKGEFVVLLGPSGSGKSVLLESVVGLKELDAGRIFIGERDITALAPEERHIAYMPQDVALFPHLSIRENILFGRRVRGTLRDAEKDLDQLSDVLHIRHLLSRKRIHTLSGGERQRVALARALITHPTVLFLDESFSALDAHIRRDLLLELHKLQREMEVAVIYVTHNQDEASVVADRVAVLMDGQMVQIATPQQLFRQPADLRVARFLQISNLFPATSVQGNNCTVHGVSLQLKTPRSTEVNEPWVGIAASDIVTLRPDERPHLDAPENLLAGRIRHLDSKHPRARLHVDVLNSEDLMFVCEITARDHLTTNGPWRVGERASIYLSPHCISLFPKD